MSKSTKQSLEDVVITATKPLINEHKFRPFTSQFSSEIYGIPLQKKKSEFSSNDSPSKEPKGLSSLSTEQMENITTLDKLIQQFPKKNTICVPGINTDTPKEDTLSRKQFEQIRKKELIEHILVTEEQKCLISMEKEDLLKIINELVITVHKLSDKVQKQRDETCHLQTEKQILVTKFNETLKLVEERATLIKENDCLKKQLKTQA